MDKHHFPVFYILLPYPSCSIMVALMELINCQNLHVKYYIIYINEVFFYIFRYSTISWWEFLLLIMFFSS